MTDMGIALALHVICVIWWIGGLGFVTFVLLPLLRSGKMGDIQTGFHAIEQRFAPQVKIAMITVAATGLYMLYRLDLWSWFTNPRTWYIWGMVLYWTWFALMLFVLGPSGLLKKIMKGTSGDEVKAWKRLHFIHGFLFFLGLIVIFGAVGGNHGFF